MKRLSKAREQEVKANVEDILSQFFEKGSFTTKKGKEIYLIVNRNGSITFTTKEIQEAERKKMEANELLGDGTTGDGPKHVHTI